MTDLTTDLLQPQNLLLLTLSVTSLLLKPRGSGTEARLLFGAQLLAVGNATVMTELGQPELIACSVMVGALVTGYAVRRRELSVNPWLRFTPAARPALIPVQASRT